MKLALSALLIITLSTAVTAIECNPSGGQLEMNRCALDDYEKSDLQLNQTWNALIDRFKKDKKHVEQLRAAQRAWIKFRDAEVGALFPCDEPNKRICFGSMYPLLHSVALQEMTEARTRSLQNHLNDGVVASSSGNVNDKSLLTTLPSFLGMQSGDKLSDHQDKLKATVIKTGEGDFEAFAIYHDEKRVGHIYPAIQNEAKIGSIVITAPIAATERGIKVGSTWGELKDNFPQIPVHDSEIEGQIFANHGHISYKLNVNFWSYELTDEQLTSIKNSTEIIEIWLN